MMIGNPKPLLTVVLPATLVLLALLCSCSGEKNREVVIYCALDRNFSEPLLKEFENRTGIHVEATYDVEATKTVGLVKTIQEEMNRPRCDVFWNNEIVNTVRLKKLGALQPYQSPNAAGIPAGFRDEDGFWTGFAARARVFIVNTDLLPDPAQWPSSYLDLLNPAFKGQGGMAKPLTGTTATHGVVLFQKLPREEAEAFFNAIWDQGVNLTSGNAHLMRLVRRGEFAFGFTDTDDYNVARVDEAGYPVAVVYPDQGDGQMGTLVLPNTVAMIKDGPHPEEARALIDYILSLEVEEKLAFSDSAQIPLHPGVKKPDYVKVPGEDFRAMVVDFDKAADDFPSCMEFFRKVFVR